MAIADAAVMQQLAPTGKLRVAIAVAPSPSAQFAIKDGDNYRGVAVTLGTALAKKLGVPVELVAHQNSGEIQNSAAGNKWDIAFIPVDDERKKFVDFGNAYHLLQSTFLVAPGSKIASVKDADAEGVAIGGVANTASFRAAKKATPKATHIDFVGVDAAVAAMLDRKIEASGGWGAARLRFRASRFPASSARSRARASSTTLFSTPRPRSACPRPSRPRSPMSATSSRRRKPPA
jgi:polar amino acid transport system substrate-binding protein